MRFFTFLLFLSLFHFNGKAQTSRYFPLPDSNVVWNTHLELYCFMTGGYSNSDCSIVISGDTLINGLVYHPLSSPTIHNYHLGSCPGPNVYTPSVYYGAIRQDTLQHKVFIVPSDSTSEEILYDFTLQVGDTVTGYLQAGYPGMKDVVLGIDSFLVAGFYHRALFINSIYSIYYIEGVGSTYGLIYPSPGNVSDAYMGSILCMKVNGSTIFPAGQSSCNMILNVSPLEDENYRWIFPIPIISECTIEASSVNRLESFEIFDCFGKSVFKREITKEVSYNWKRENLATGIYLIKVQFENGTIKVRKVSLN